MTAAGVAIEPDPARPPGLSVDAVIERHPFRLDVAFTVRAGETLGVLGPNGAGKTTLLRALAGLSPLTHGHIHLDGQVLDDAASGRFLAPELRPVGLVFQDYRLFPHLSVRNNIAFGPRCRGVDRRAAAAIADEWLDRLAIADLATRRPAQLSGGQAQRVALGRALACRPALLLMDEPLAALDARTRLEVRAELRHHLSAFAGPTLIVTHDPLEAMIMTDRLLVLEQGRIVQQGPPGEIAEHPATEYVARLVGLNLYPGTRSSGTEIDLDAGGTMWVADAPRLPPDADHPGHRVLVAIRPAAIALHVTRPTRSSPRNVWTGTITGLEPLLDRVRVQVTGQRSALVDVTPAAVADLDLVRGTPVWLTAKATDIEAYAAPDTAPGPTSRTPS